LDTNRMIYLIGSLRNPAVPHLADRLRARGLDVFDDWYSAGPEADDHWQAYEKARGRSMREALDAPHAHTVFRFDKMHLDRATDVVLVMPGGKSAHLELGYSVGMGKRAFVYFDKEPERWDVMYRFANAVCFGENELIDELSK
jgi:hypothetical protein